MLECEGGGGVTRLQFSGSMYNCSGILIICPDF